MPPAGSANPAGAYAAPGGEWLGWLAAIGAVSMWAAWAVATRGTLQAYTGRIDAIDIVALRFAVAGLITLPVAIARPPRLSRLGGLGSIVVAGTGGFTFSLCNTSGLAFAPAAHSGALVAPLGAVFVGLAAAFILNEALPRRRISGLALIVAGAFGIVAATWAGDAPRSIFVGHALFLGAALQWTTYTVLVRRAGLAPIEAMLVACVGSALLYVPAWLVLRGPSALLALPAGVLAVQAVLHGVVAQTLSIVLFNFGVARLGAARAAACGALLPPMVALGATLFLAEPPSWAELPGLAALSLGVWLATVSRARPG